MSNTVIDQIKNELDKIELGIDRLQSHEREKEREVDLEITILTRQVESLRTAKDLALKKIDDSMSILKKLRSGGGI